MFPSPLSFQIGKLVQSSQVASKTTRWNIVREEREGILSHVWKSEKETNNIIAPQVGGYMSNDSLQLTGMDATILQQSEMKLKVTGRDNPPTFPLISPSSSKSISLFPISPGSWVVQASWHVRIRIKREKVILPFIPFISAFSSHSISVKAKNEVNRKSLPEISNFLS